MIEFFFGLIIGGGCIWLAFIHEVSMMHQDALRMKRRVEAMQQEVKRFRGTL